MTDPEGFEPPYVLINTPYSGKQPRRVYKGCMLLLKDGKPSGVMSEREFDEEYMPIEKAHAELDRHCGYPDNGRHDVY